MSDKSVFDFTKFFDTIKEAESFLASAKNIKSWVEKFRFIEGKPWSYEAAGPIIMYGVNDIKSENIKKTLSQSIHK